MKKYILAVLLGAGCVQIPTTKLDYGDFHARLPKDDQAASVTVDILTNRTLHIKVTKLNAANNPDVINSSATGQVEIIKATGDAIGQTVGTALKAIVK